MYFDIVLKFSLHKVIGLKLASNLYFHEIMRYFSQIQLTSFAHCRSAPVVSQSNRKKYECVFEAKLLNLACKDNLNCDVQVHIRGG